MNQRFADALLEEMDDSADPVVFVQDYHLALLPRLIKKARPDARVAIFWHIPWPNPEAFGICPWQAELLDGLLGADLIGFHIPLHCNNFLATVDRAAGGAHRSRAHDCAPPRALEHVRPYPVSVAFDGAMRPRGQLGTAETMERTRRCAAAAAERVRRAGGVPGGGRGPAGLHQGNRGAALAIEQLLEEHPWHRERLTMVQIAAPSRTRIPSYAELRRRVEETVERINPATRLRIGGPSC